MKRRQNPLRFSQNYLNCLLYGFYDEDGEDNLDCFVMNDNDVKRLWATHGKKLKTLWPYSEPLCFAEAVAEGKEPSYDELEKLYVHDIEGAE